MAGTFAAGSLVSRPGGHSKYSVVVDGIPEMRAAFKLLPDVAKEAFRDAVFVTASEIVRQARGYLVPGHGFRTGALKESLGFRVTPHGEARIGIRRGFQRAIAGRGGRALTSRGARLHIPTKIGHLVEFGHGGPHPAPPHRFLRPAYESQREAFLDRCRRAGRTIEQQMAARASAAAGARVA